jgi:hypothetical protein
MGILKYKYKKYAASKIGFYRAGLYSGDRLDPYSGRARFEFLLGHGQPYSGFRVFSQSLQKMSE